MKRSWLYIMLGGLIFTFAACAPSTDGDSMQDETMMEGEAMMEEGEEMMDEAAADDTVMEDATGEDEEAEDAEDEE